MKSKKGFTMIELISVIALLGIIIVIVATKGFGAFDNTKEKINVENENTIKEAANFLMTEVKSCEGNEDIYNNLIDGSFDSTIKDCKTLKERATKKVDGSGCLNISLKYLIDNNYITSDGAKDINKKYEEYIIKGCLEPVEEKIVIEISEKKTKGPVVSYSGPGYYLYGVPDKYFNLEKLYEKITCTVEDASKSCKKLTATLFSGEGANKVVYYEGEFNKFDGKNLSLENSNIKYNDDYGKTLGDDVNEYGTYTLSIVAQDTDDVDAEYNPIEIEIYNYTPIIKYNYKGIFVKDQLDLTGLSISNLISNGDYDPNYPGGTITCADEVGNKCQSINFKIINNSNGNTLYEGEYNYETHSPKIIYGDPSNNLDIGEYLLEITGSVKDRVEGKYDVEGTSQVLLNVWYTDWNYNFGFNGENVFEKSTVNTEDLDAFCYDYNAGKECENWSYEIRSDLNNSYGKWVFPPEDITLNDLEGSYDAYFYIPNEYGEVFYTVFEDAFFVYPICYEEVEECEMVCEDTSGYETVCYDPIEVCYDYPFTCSYTDEWGNLQAYDCYMPTCSYEDNCQLEWIYRCEDRLYCETVLREKDSCLE